MKFFLATKNKHKIEEFTRMLNPLGIQTLSEHDLDKPLTDVEETGATFDENAILKAKSAMLETGLPSIADDSGLCVDYLDGAPGIYSARFAGEPTDNDKNNEKLLTLLKDVPVEKRGAKFVCVIACVFPDGRTFTVYGDCKGHIGFEPLGNKGFGYDPLFITEIGCFGEISDKQKDSISHRGRALTRFCEEIKKYI